MLCPNFTKNNFYFWLINRIVCNLTVQPKPFSWMVHRFGPVIHFKTLKFVWTSVVNGLDSFIFTYIFNLVRICSRAHEKAWAFGTMFFCFTDLQFASKFMYAFPSTHFRWIVVCSWFTNTVGSNRQFLSWINAISDLFIDS